VQPKDYSVALNLTGTLTDDPDAMLYENYACGGVGNYNGYCNPEVDRMIEQQSREPDQEKRKRIVWEIARRLVEDDAKPVLYFGRGGKSPLRQLSA
jgi:peptide/nickel transport system substrate-binding protein